MEEKDLEVLAKIFQQQLLGWDILFGQDRHKALNQLNSYLNLIQEFNTQNLQNMDLLLWKNNVYTQNSNEMVHLLRGLYSKPSSTEPTTNLNSTLTSLDPRLRSSTNQQFEKDTPSFVKETSITVSSNSPYYDRRESEQNFKKSKNNKISGGAKSDYKSRPRICYSCRNQGHVAKNCPLKNRSQLYKTHKSTVSRNYFPQKRPNYKNVRQISSKFYIKSNLSNNEDNDVQINLPPSEKIEKNNKQYEIIDLTLDEEDEPKDVSTDLQNAFNSLPNYGQLEISITEKIGTPAKRPLGSVSTNYSTDEFLSNSGYGSDNDTSHDNRKQVTCYSPPTINYMLDFCEENNFSTNHFNDKDMFRFNSNETIVHEFSQPKTIARMKPDGNCGFRAISTGLTGTQENHGEIRALIYKHMVENQHRFGRLNPQMGEVAMNAMDDRYWFDQNCLIATEELFKVDIIVLKRTVNSHSYFGGEYKNVLTVFDGSYNEPSHQEAEEKPTIALLHENNHFDLVVDFCSRF